MWVWDTVVRVAPILVFLMAITVVAELADAAGVLEAAARIASLRGGGSVRRLWLLVVLLATVTTVLLSLDTTAVLLTPVVLALAAQLGIAPWPFALATVWLANTASLPATGSCFGRPSPSVQPSVHCSFWASHRGSLVLLAPAS